MYQTNTKAIYRVGQNRTYTPYMTVYLVGGFPAKNTVCMWFWPTLAICIISRPVFDQVLPRPETGTIAACNPMLSFKTLC